MPATVHARVGDRHRQSRRPLSVRQSSSQCRASKVSQRFQITLEAAARRPDGAWAIVARSSEGTLQVRLEANPLFHESNFAPEVRSPIGVGSALRRPVLEVRRKVARLSRSLCRTLKWRPTGESVR